jgi:hypothetical protein
MRSMLLALIFTSPLGGLLFCLRAITVNPALVTSDNAGQEGCVVRGDLMMLLVDIYKLLLLISCQILHQARNMNPNKRT